MKKGSEKMNAEEIPAKEECLELLKQNQTPERVINHSLQVAKVAVFIAEKLKEKGVEINTALVQAAALLHDIKRAEKSEKGHHILGHDLLFPTYPEIAKIIKCHIPMCVTPPSSLHSWEAKVVFYADKRIEDNKIVSLERRYEYIIEKCTQRGKLNILDEIKESFPHAQALEREIFNIIDADVSLDELKD